MTSNTRNWSKLGQQVHALADLIEEQGGPLNADLTESKAGRICVYGEDTYDTEGNRLVVSLGKLVDEMLDNASDHPDEVDYATLAGLQRWAQLLRRLAKRIETKIGQIKVELTGSKP
jgi:hypothetical protein